jgi:sterol desaturase/sphingolipid hydroxylase (fatty acid hydroxylase superfamily)
MSEVKDILGTALLITFLAFLVLENLFPYRKEAAKVLGNSYITNVLTFIFNNLLLSALSITSLFLIAERFSEFGLLSRIDYVPLKFVIAFVLFDLTMYLWHSASHKYRFLWKLHRVHHSDSTLNVSTTFRFHMGELVLTVILKSICIIALGIDATTVVACELLTTLLEVFHHANIRFRGESLVARILITPYLHRAHHSTEQIEQNSNYGIVLSVWDRMFGTLREAVPETIGLKGISNQSFFDAIRLGFVHNVGKKARLSISPRLVTDRI